MSSLLSDYDFALPEAQIAQAPLGARDASRLMVVSRSTGAWEHRHFADLPGLLREGDLLVVNTSATLAAALSTELAGRP